MSAVAQGDQKRAAHFLKLVSQVAVNSLIWVLGTVLGSSARASDAIQGRVIHLSSPTLSLSPNATIMTDEIVRTASETPPAIPGRRTICLISTRDRVKCGVNKENGS